MFDFKIVFLLIGAATFIATPLLAYYWGTRDEE